MAAERYSVFYLVIYFNENTGIYITETSTHLTVNAAKVGQMGKQAIIRGVGRERNITVTCPVSSGHHTRKG